MKKLIVFCLLLAVSFIPLFGQGMPVLDVANLVQSIENVYQFGVQIENTIEQVKAQYEAIEQAYQQMMGMNWDDLSDLGDSFKDNSANPMDWIRDTRNATQKVLGAVNDNMNKVNKLKSELYAQNISFGGMDVSFMDLIGGGDLDRDIGDFLWNAINTTGDEVTELARIWAGGLTYEEREEIMDLYGMSPENYASARLAEYELYRVIDECIVKGSEKGIEDTLTEFMGNSASLIEMMKDVPEGSTYAQNELLISGLAQLVSGLGQAILCFHDIGSLIANYWNAERQQEAAEAWSFKDKVEQAKTNRQSAFADDWGWYHVDGTFSD